MEKYDVAVFGAGIAGLLLSRALAKAGLTVILIEREDLIGSKATTRNEGWLHSGSYHAQSIREASEAIGVAKRCIEGHQYYRREFPGAIDNAAAECFAVLADADRRSDIEDRWQRAGVRFELVPVSDLRARDPHLRLLGAQLAYRVADVGINVPYVCRRLIYDLRSLGVNIQVELDVATVSAQEIVCLRPDGQHFVLQADNQVYTTGYGSGRLLAKFFPDAKPLRFFRSHLMIAPKNCNCDVFFLDPDYPAGMSHDKSVIIGLNEDATELPLPDVTVDAAKADHLFERAQLLFDLPDRSKVEVYACVKTDLPADETADRSLNIAVRHLSETQILALPGKLTEAPVMAERLARQIVERYPMQLVAKRPMDEWNAQPKVAMV